VYQNKPVIIKDALGNLFLCGLCFAAQYLHPFAKSIMYGEACSAVPLYKSTRKTNLLQLFYTLVEDFKMKVMNKIAFLSYCFYLLSAAAQNSNRL
jgi:hypothetical protein